MTTATATRYCGNCLDPLPAKPHGSHCSAACANQGDGDGQAIAYYTGRADARYGRPADGRVRLFDPSPRAIYYFRGYTDEQVGRPW